MAETLWPGKSKRVALRSFPDKMCQPWNRGPISEAQKYVSWWKIYSQKNRLPPLFAGRSHRYPHCPDCAVGVSRPPNSEPRVLLPETASYFGEHLALIGQTLLVTQLSIKMPRPLPRHVTHAEPTPAA